MAEVSAPMGEGAFVSEFFKEWDSLMNEEQDQPSTMSLRKKTKPNSRPPSRLVGESEEQRERRLRQARECSLRRRSMETPDERDKRLHDQRTRMALRRKNETANEKETRQKKARDRERQRRRSESGEKREMRLKYSRERASLRREKETPEERQKRLELSRTRAAERRKQKKLVDDGQPSTDSLLNSPSPGTGEKPKTRKRTPRPPRSVTRRKEKAELQDSSPIPEYPITDESLSLEEYKVCVDFSKTDSGSSSSNGNSRRGAGGERNNGSNGSFADSMVGVGSGHQMMSDVGGGLAPPPHTQSPLPPLSSSLDTHHSSSLEGDAGMTMILTTNPFHHSEASAFQPPPVHQQPPPPHSVQQMSSFSELSGGGAAAGVHPSSLGVKGGNIANGNGMVAGNRRVGEEILEGMGYLEHRYQIHPDFTMREQQNRGYNIQAVVLRNS